MSININPQIMIHVKTLGSGLKKPDSQRNYCIYNEKRVKFLADNEAETLPYVVKYLQTSNDENGVLEALFVIDKIADKMNANSLFNGQGARDLDKIYPYLARFNNSDSPEIQSLLSGIYRKILVPDAFGPLCAMFQKQINHPVSKYFDPKEETGGAILEYIRAYSAGYAYKPSENKIIIPNFIGVA